MKPKSILSIFLIIAVCAGAAYYFFKFYKKDQQLKSQEETIVPVAPIPEAGLVDDSLIEVKHIEKEDAYSIVDVKYPYLRNIPTIENDAIRTTFERAIKEHSLLSSDNFKARAETGGGSGPLSREDKYPFYAEYKVIQANSDFVSILFTYGGYQGGAHGYENVFSFNYDVKNKKKVYLKDVFKKESDPIGFISEESRKKLLEKLLPQVMYQKSFDTLSFKNDEDVNTAEMIYAGTEPETSNFKVYTFTPTEVSFYFSEYQVAAYAYGRQEVSLSYVPALYAPALPPPEIKAE